MKSKPVIPTLRGFVSADRTMINVFCPSCDAFHYHSWSPANKPSKTEHRSAHCCVNRGVTTYENRPFRVHGYYIGEITPAKMKGTYK